MPQAADANRTRVYWFIFLLVLCCLRFWKPLAALFSLSLANEHYSQVLVIPVLSGYLLFRERHKIFSSASTAPGATNLALLAAVASLLLGGGFAWILSPDERLALQILSLVGICIGLFFVCFGVRPFRAALFPLLLLLVAVPFPQFLVDQLIVGLQQGSAASASLFFRAFGVPVLQEGFSFSLPGFTIQIAQECSGIRSSLALLITGLLGGHLFLRSWWSKLGLCMAIVPLAVLKNGFRIAALSWLGLHVDRGFLTGNLHRRGGILFFLISLVVLALLARLLQRLEGDQSLIPTPHGPVKPEIA